MAQHPREPLLSIITVCRNHRRGLARTHASLAALPPGRVEWLVQDGASTDGTVAFAEQATAPQAALVSAPDSGLYDAMNRATTRARGNHLMFLNAGDQLADATALTHLLGVWANGQRQPPDLLLGASLVTDRGGWRLKPARTAQLSWLGMPTHHPAMLFRRSLVADLRYDTRYRIAADYAFFLDALARADRVDVLASPLARIEPGGLSERDAALGRREQSLIRRARWNSPLALECLLRAAQAVHWALRRRWPEAYAGLRLRGTPGGQPE